MALSQLTARNFRNFKEFSVDLSPGTTLIKADNAQGKTNFIEAAFLLSSGASFRTRDHNLVLNKEQFYVVEGATQGPVPSVIRVTFDAQGQKKVFTIDNRKVLSSELFELMPAVLFHPDDVRLIIGEPAGRRKWLDELLSILNPYYRAAISDYKKILTQRSHVLWKIRDGKGTLSELEIWDIKLSELAAEIVRIRTEEVAKISKKISSYYQDLSNKKREISLRYIKTFSGDINPESFYRALNSVNQQDIALTATSIGPHRDDFIFLLGESNMAAKASRGEIRTAVLSATFEKLELIQKKFGQVLLLLDDVFSELDETRSQALMERIKGQQVIITTTRDDLNLINHPTHNLSISRGSIKILQ